MPDNSQSSNKWYVLAVAALTNAFAFAAPTMCMPVLFKEISAELSLDLVQVGTIWGMVSLGSVLILLISGIPILQALEIAKQVIQNSVIANAMNSVKDLVGKGEAIAYAIRKTVLFPPIVYHIIATGQVGGNLEEGLMDIAVMYDGEVELATKTLTSLLEPVILLCMGAVVAFIVLAVLLPIFDINQIL